MIIKKLWYSVGALFHDILGIEDYWHLKTPSNNVSKQDTGIRYYLDFSKKGFYPFILKDDIPIVTIDSTPTIFPITVFNYGLGLIDLYGNGEAVSTKLKAVLDWTILMQTKDGFWLAQHESKYWGLKKGWKSAMAQGLAISFLYRCWKINIISRTDLDKVMDISLRAMYSSSLTNKTIDGIVLQEYSGTNSNILNGFIFAIFGLHDYGKYTGNYEYYNASISTLMNILPKYCYRDWTYYSGDKMIASNFYHNLHIEQLKALYELDPNSTFKYYIKLWERGLKKRLYYVISKSFQKLFSFSSINTLD